MSTVSNRTFNEEMERAAQDGTEYQFGAIEKDLAIVPLALRKEYLPVGVLQFNNVFDTFGCASRSVLNIAEAKLNYFYLNGMHPDIKKWCDDNGYRVDGKFKLADAFLEILSETTPQGNSLKKPLDTFRKVGAIPARYLPLEDGMTWEDYMNPARITKEMKDLGVEFAARIQWGYEQVSAEQFLGALQQDYLDVAAAAWPPPVDGIYPRNDAPFNHAFATTDPSILAFDTYQPFHKTLAKDYKFFDWGYSLSITAQNPNPVKDQLTLIGHLLNVIGVLLEQLFPKPAYDVPPASLPMNSPDNRREALLERAKMALGKDVSPLDLADDELGCVESLTAILREIVPVPSLLSTRELHTFLKSSPDFKGTLELKPGNIVLSITGTGLPGTRGHCGILLENDRIASNTSKTGKWEDNYSVASWVKSFRTQKGMKMLVFEVI